MLLFFLQGYNAQELICVSIHLVDITGQFPSQSRNQTTGQSVDTRRQQSLLSALQGKKRRAFPYHHKDARSLELTFVIIDNEWRSEMQS